MIDVQPGETPRQADARRLKELQASRQARKEAGYSKPYQAVAESFGGEAMEQAAKEGNSDAVLGHMLSNQALAAAPLAAEQILRVSPKVASAAGKAATTVKEGIAGAVRTEGGTGPLKPAVKTAAQVTGGLAGAAHGLAHGEITSTVLGGEYGSRLGAKLADIVTPRLKPMVPIQEMGAPLPSTEEFYASRGAEINAIRKQTATAERATARAQTKEAAPVPITEPPNFDSGAFRAGAAKRTTASPGPFRVVSQEAPKNHW
jgi:hypothetical protein